MKNIVKSKKVIISCLMCVLLLLSAFLILAPKTIAAKADSVVDPYPQLAFTLLGDHYSVRAKDKNLEKAIVPAYYNGYPITEVASNGFASCKNLTEVVLPPTVTSIGTGGFMSNANLKRATMVGDIEVGQNAFAMCSSVEKVYIPNPVSISSYAFRNFPSTAKISLGVSEQETLSWTNWLASSSATVNFDCAEMLEEVEIDGVAGYNIVYSSAIDYSDKTMLIDTFNYKPILNIGMFAFSEGKINVLNIGTESNHRINIENYAFMFADINAVEFGKNVTFNDVTSNDSLSDGVLQFSNVQFVKFSETHNVIYKNMFYGCEYLNSIQFGDGTVNTLPIVSIGEQAFADCSLQNVIIKSNITSIGQGAFQSWDSGRAIKIDLYASEVTDFINSGTWSQDWAVDCDVIIDYKKPVTLYRSITYTPNSFVVFSGPDQVEDGTTIVFTVTVNSAYNKSIPVIRVNNGEPLVPKSTPLLPDPLSVEIMPLAIPRGYIYEIIVVADCTITVDPMQTNPPVSTTWTVDFANNEYYGCWSYGYPETGFLGQLAIDGSLGRATITKGYSFTIKVLEKKAPNGAYKLKVGSTLYNVSHGSLITIYPTSNITVEFIKV